MNTESMDWPCMTSPRIPFIPLPMAVFGMMMAFMFGAMFGKMLSHKHEMMMRGSHGGPMMHGRMMGHHHHGEGSPACRAWHDESTSADVQPMDS